jgi:hypothetical protein
MERIGSQFKKIPETNALDGLQRIAAIAKSVLESDPSVFAALSEIMKTPVPASDPSPVTTTQPVFSLPVTTMKSVTKKAVVRRKSVFPSRRIGRERVEYCWGITKGLYRRKPLLSKKGKESFRKLVCEVTSRDILKTATIRKLSRRARAYIYA